MNAEYSPVDDGSNNICAELQGLLRDAVTHIRQSHPSHERMKAMLGRAAGWAHRVPVQSAPQSWRFAALVAAIIAMLTLSAGMLGYWLGTSSPGAGQQRPIAQARKESMSMQDDNRSQTPPTGPERPAAAVGSPPLDRDGAVSFGSKPSGTQAAPAPLGVGGQGGRAAGASPSRWAFVANNATVIVSTGADMPIKLGERQAFSRAHQLHVWDWSKGDESRPLAVEHTGGFAVSPDGKAIVTTDGQAIETESGMSRRLEHFDGEVHKVRFSEDGKTLVLQIDQGDHATIRLLDFPAGTKRVDIEEQFVYMFGVDFLRNGRELALMSKDKSIRRFDAGTGGELMKYEPAHTNSIRAIAISPDGKRMASAGPAGEVFLWELQSGKLVSKLSTRYPNFNYDDEVYSLEFSPDSKFLAGGGSQRLVLWNADSGEVEHLYGRDSAGAIHIRFSADGSEMTTVRGFYETRDDAGRDLLVYPTVHTQKVEQKN